MKPSLAVIAENLSKRYRIGQGRAPYRTFRETLVGLVTRPLRCLRKASAARPEIWALRDVSFELRHGEVLGIIGRNGSGKSTLLKVLSRITEPTQGRATIRGRVGSLLEVGIGFHPELTGRENIFLNGAILGMRRHEIARKFDEIVAFAEIERFLDTPVKHYSSGMYVRLAFAVAAHLDTEILFMDEVLAVGDLAFQKKCLGKMGEVGHQGRTILFVSHQMNQIRRLCSTCLWLEAGRVQHAGPTAEVVSSYEAAFTHWATTDDRNESGRARFTGWAIVDPVSEQPNCLSTFGPLTVSFSLSVSERIRGAHHGIGLYSSDQQLVWGTATNDLDFEPGRYALLYRLPGLPLRPGPYFWRLSLHGDSGLVDCCDFPSPLNISTPPVTHPRDEWAGILNVPYDLTVRREP